MRGSKIERIVNHSGLSGPQIKVSFYKKRGGCDQLVYAIDVNDRKPESGSECRLIMDSKSGSDLIAQSWMWPSLLPEQECSPIKFGPNIVFVSRMIRLRSLGLCSYTHKTSPSGSYTISRLGLTVIVTLCAASRSLMLPLVSSTPISFPRQQPRPRGGAILEDSLWESRVSWSSLIGLKPPDDCHRGWRAERAGRTLLSSPGNMPNY